MNKGAFIFHCSDLQAKEIEKMAKICRTDIEGVLHHAFKALGEKINRQRVDEQIVKSFHDAPLTQLRPASFEHETTIFNPPVGMTEEEVYAICASEVNWGDDFPAIVTCWRMSEESLIQVQDQKRIWIATMGEKLQPLCVSTDSPFDQPWCTLRKPKL